jgi:hypothetical protein
MATDRQHLAAELLELGETLFDTAGDYLISQGVSQICRAKAR